MIRQPRPVTRDIRGRTHLCAAESALWAARIHATMCHTDRCLGLPDSRWHHSAEWDAQDCARHLAAVDGPRSARTRARRLARRLGRVLDRLCGGAT